MNILRLSVSLLLALMIASCADLTETTSEIDRVSPVDVVPGPNYELTTEETSNGAIIVLEVKQALVDARVTVDSEGSIVSRSAGLQCERVDSFRSVCTPTALDNLLMPGSYVIDVTGSSLIDVSVSPAP